MIYLVAAAGWLFSAWRWGDWRNWRQYHHSILYMCICDIFYYYLTSHYPLWRLEPKGVVSNHTLAIVIELGIFICSILIYLGRFPKGKWKSVLWISFWVVLYTTLEWGLQWFGVFTYFHGWSLFKSFLFNILSFSMIRFHFSRPIAAYLLSIPITILLLYLNHVPVK